MTTNEMDLQASSSEMVANSDVPTSIEVEQQQLSTSMSKDEDIRTMLTGNNRAFLLMNFILNCVLSLVGHQTNQKIMKRFLENAIFVEQDRIYNFGRRFAKAVTWVKANTRNYAKMTDLNSFRGSIKKALEKNFKSGQFELLILPYLKTNDPSLYIHVVDNSETFRKKFVTGIERDIADALIEKLWSYDERRDRFGRDDPLGVFQGLKPFFQNIIRTTASLMVAGGFRCEIVGGQEFLTLNLWKNTPMEFTFCDGHSAPYLLLETIGWLEELADNVPQTPSLTVGSATYWMKKQKEEKRKDCCSKGKYVSRDLIYELAFGSKFQAASVELECDERCVVEYESFKTVEKVFMDYGEERFMHVGGELCLRERMAEVARALTKVKRGLLTKDEVDLVLAGIILRKRME